MDIACVFRCMESFITELPNNVQIIKSKLPISDFDDLIEFENKLTDNPNFKLTAVSEM